MKFHTAIIRALDAAVREGGKIGGRSKSPAKISAARANRSQGRLETKTKK